MRKKLLLIVLVLVFALSLTLVACQPKTPNDDHTHTFVDGVCKDCGAKDPSYVDPNPPVHTHNYVDGVCTECGAKDPSYVDPNPPQPSSVLPTDYPKTASEPSIMLHYKRESEKDYLKWGFWIWSDGAEGQLFNLNYQDDFGGIAIYPLSAFGATETSRIGIIPRLQSDWVKDCDADRMLELSTLTKDENNYLHVYLKEGDVNLYKQPNEMQYASTAWFRDGSTVIVNSNAKIVSLVLKGGETEYAQVDGKSKNRVEFSLPENTVIDLSDKIVVVLTFDDGATADVSVGLTRLFDSKEFAAAYHYDGELGAIYSASHTEFRVWSPVATKILLNIYEHGNGAETPRTVEMTKGEKAVYSANIEEDLGGKYYTYTVFSYAYPKGVEIVDPYAKSAGLSGLRGQIVNFAETNPAGWDEVEPIGYDRKELVVWETHVADVTSSATWTGTEDYRKKFLGVIESGTTYTENNVTVKTGFDHIVELGVNAVQLVPIFDQANDEANMKFNWGYNPLNYNVLEGGYSTDPTDGYSRIREFKQLVQAFNGKGINVIMDVVYNHVNSANGSNFDVLMPGYFYRYDAKGIAYNGSGCGNETASDHSMFRKFMIDSVCFWAKEYKLGGFRFDLMALHDIETMNLLVDALQQINENIVVYGEPWTGGTSGLSPNLQAKQDNAKQFDDFGQFNDQMRDALIKSGMKGVTETGWITNNQKVADSDLNTVISGMKGITKNMKDPDKTVNYVTCHDNYTLYDRIKAAGITDETVVKQMAMLANSVVFTSNGTTFMLAGEEFLRTKNVDGATTNEVHNSYQSSYKINELDYARKIANADMFANYQRLIALKKDCSGLHLDESEIEGNYTVTKLANGSALRVDIVDEENGKVYRVIHANGTLKDLTVDLSGWSLYLDTLGTTTELSATTQISPYQTIIVCKETTAA